MIEKTLLDYLKAHILNVAIEMEIPANRPEKLITIQRIDGGKNNHIKAATFSIECYDTSKYKTVLLNETVKEMMEAFGDEPSVFSCNQGGESDNTDTQNKLYCYETIWNVYF